jgi:hypothetical protein
MYQPDWLISMIFFFFPKNKLIYFLLLLFTAVDSFSHQLSCKCILSLVTFSTILYYMKAENNYI